MQVLSGIREEGCVRWTPLNPGRSLPEAAPSTRRFTPNRPRLALYVVLAALLLGGTAAAEEIEELVYTQSDYEEFENDDCLECHGDEDIEADTERGEELELYVEDEVLLSSVHEEQLCTDCHRGAQDFEDSPHNEGEALGLNCSGSGCHGEVVTEYDRSIHGKWHAKGDEEAATCKDCHGNHSILSSSDRKSRTNKFNLHKTCAECHESEVVLERRPIDYDQAVPDFVDSIHGKALLVDGLIVAPSCNDCHGVHDILPHEDPDSRISRETVPKTCGECHVLVEEIFNASVHGESVNSHDVSAPHCTSCHKSHVSEPPFSPEFRLHADRMCGECHEEQLVGYRDTFHGKAIALGRGDVAACYDCHGHHDIVKIDNPTSRLSDERRVETCKQCHEDANPNFANYIVHADHNDREAYPQLYYVFWGMTALLVGTFAFFALHTLLWLYRSMALYMSDSREWREAKTQVRGDTEEFTRFTPLDRFLHGLVIVSFLLLVITGMPLKFYYTDWARVLLDLMGGQAVAAVLHRIGAIITIFYFTVHVTSVLYGIFTGRKRFENPETGKIELRRIGRAFFGPDSPMPGIQDLKDVIAHNKWFFGKGPKPQFDRWTYWEKFDYMAVFWGVAMIGVSGLIMWFPEFFTRFLPGWSINVALIIHSDEALLAAGFIFTFHFFNVHFRPDKFPMDSVMFSGRMSKSELMHERKKLYDRWVAEGTLEQHRAGHEWDAWKKIALPAGFTAFLVGVVLMLLIYVAMASRLLGG
jgi:thiosulfate reductase cytochrome b subunit